MSYIIWIPLYWAFLNKQTLNKTNIITRGRHETIYHRRDVGSENVEISGEITQGKSRFVCLKAAVLLNNLQYLYVRSCLIFLVFVYRILE